MEDSDALDEAELTAFVDDGDDEDLNDTQALYREDGTYSLNEDLTVEVIPMGPSETSCPSCFLVVPATSLVEGRCRECG